MYASYYMKEVRDEIYTNCAFMGKENIISHVRTIRVQSTWNRFRFESPKKCAHKTFCLLSVLNDM